MSQELDAQQVEIVGRNLLISLFVAESIEVAQPIRDKGIDLIIFDSSQSKTFHARPIQLKAVSDSRFSIDRKYEKIPYLLMAYIWHTLDPLNSTIYIMTYVEALAIAETLGYTNTSSWIDKHSYSVPNPGKELLSELEKYKYIPGRLSGFVKNSSFLSEA